MVGKKLEEKGRIRILDRIHTKVKKVWKGKKCSSEEERVVVPEKSHDS